MLPHACVFRDVPLCAILRDCGPPVFRIVFFLTVYILLYFPSCQYADYSNKDPFDKTVHFETGIL